MAEIISLIQEKAKRSKMRRSIDRFYGIELDLGPSLPICQFRARIITGDRVYILVKEDSFIFKNLKIGQELKMNYYKGENLDTTQTWHAQITNITRQIHGSLKGHFLVGFSIKNIR